MTAMSSDSDRSSSVLPGPANFATTHWSMVLDAGCRSSPACDDALSALCTAYWYPLYVFVRRRGYSASDAQDLTQGFFAHLLEKQTLQAADPARGRFRSFLLASCKNFLATQYEMQTAKKRGGNCRHLSIDFSTGERRYQFEPVDNWTPEKSYERRWAMTVLETVVQRLEQEYVADGKGQFFAQCKGHLTGNTPSYEESAQILGTSPQALRVAVHRLRSRYRELLKAEVAATLADPQAADEELLHLQRALRGE